MEMGLPFYMRFQKRRMKTMSTIQMEKVVRVIKM